MGHMQNESATLRRSMPALLVFVVAAAVNIVAAWMLMAFFARLPAAQLKQVDAGALHAALVAGQADVSDEVTDADVLVRVARRFERAWLDPGDAGTLDQNLARELSSVRTTFLGRIYHAAFVVLAAERRSASAAQRWSAAEPWLRGLDHEVLAHRGQNYLAFLARVYQASGVSAATAREATDQAFLGAAHHTVLQYFSAWLRAAEADCEGRGDEAGALTARRVRLAWLKQSVLESGPAGLRLLAADLLADDLATTEDTAAIAHDLRDWRAAYRQEALRRDVSYLGLQPRPALVPTRQRTLVRSMHLAMWLGAASAGAGLVALLTAWRWILTASTSRRWPTLLISGAVLASGATFMGVWLTSTADQSTQRALLTEASTGWWWTGLLGGAAGLTCGLLGLFKFGRGSPGPPLVRIGGTACVTWLLLGVIWLAVDGWAELGRNAWESERAAALVDEVAAMLGAQAETGLTRLRAWTPQ